MFYLKILIAKFDMILEVVGQMQDDVKRIPKMAEDIEKLEHDMSIVRLATTSTQSDTELIKIRTEKLESIQDVFADPSRHQCSNGQGLAGAQDLSRPCALH